MKIAVSGFAGTGKTTLATGLARRLGLPLIDEGMLPLAKASSAFYDPALANDPQARGAARRDFISAFVHWADARTAEYNAHVSGFVADRCELDLLNWWLVEFGRGREQIDHITDGLLRDAQHKLGLFDLVVMMPLQKPFGEDRSKNDNGMTRISTFSSNLLYTALGQGLAQMVRPSQILTLPADLTDPEARVDFVAGHLAAAS